MDTVMGLQQTVEMVENPIEASGILNLLEFVSDRQEGANESTARSKS
jgi:hypothetical protein